MLKFGCVREPIPKCFNRSERLKQNNRLFQQNAQTAYYFRSTLYEYRELFFRRNDQYSGLILTRRLVDKLLIQFIRIAILGAEFGQAFV